MAIEYGGSEKPIEVVIKSKIAKVMGFAGQGVLKETKEATARGSVVSTHHLFGNEVLGLYEFVDRTASVVRRLRLIKK